MIEKVFYNSSLPRAGSTLIQNILAQNPDIHASPTSGIYEMFTHARNVFTEGQEWKAQNADLMDQGFRGFLKGAIYGFYNNITDRPFAVDKCRGWVSEYSFINEFDPEPRIFVMVRDLRGIFSSLEKKFRAYPLKEHHIANYNELTGTTTEKRIIHWSNNVPLAPSLERLYDTLYQGLDKNILFIKFEDLMATPQQELDKIYTFFGLPSFEHDFYNIRQYTQEDDRVYGIFGDHVIRPVLESPSTDYEAILGANGSAMVIENYQWFYDYFGYNV